MESFFQAALSKPKCGIPNTNDRSRITSNLICIPDHPLPSSLLTLKKESPYLGLSTLAFKDRGISTEFHFA